MAMIIAIVVFLLIIGIMVFVVIRAFKQTDPNRVDTSTRDDITTAQEFLPFEDIRDSMIILGDHKYRAVIECTSTNYNLKTDKEKELIEVSFQRFLNSLTFPITMYVQTRTIDNSKILERMEEELQEVIKEYPQLSNYANIYFHEMKNLNSYIGNNKQKKKYIIVPFEDVYELNDLTDEEKYEHAQKELLNRASLIIDSLVPVGVKAKVLNTAEIAELVFSTYHKDNYGHVENVVNGEFLTLFVQGETNRMENIDDDARLDWILYEAQMRIQNELMRDDVPEFLKRNFVKSIAEIDKLRDETSGYFKQRDHFNPYAHEQEASGTAFEMDMRKQQMLNNEQGGNHA